MKQSTSKSNREKTAALYVRLSSDDGRDGDSFSISNQKKMLTKIAKEKGYTNLLTYSDDGYSGTTMERPDFKRMISDIEKGVIGAVIVKDMSRLGRNYLKVGHYTEEFFPEHDIRLIAVSDGVDSSEGDNEFTPFRNIMNEWYARDISKKRRMVNTLKGNAGEPLSPPPYGYVKDPENDKRWVVDPEAATVVKRIFDMTLDGLGTEQIASALQKDGVLTPISYWLSKGLKRGHKRSSDTPDKWAKQTVMNMLYMQEYCGDVINFKTYSKSYKHKKRIANDVENMAIFEGVHEPIIDRATFEKVQQKRNKARKRKSAVDGEKNMFSGLVVCADCGHNLWFHFNQTNHEIKYFNCSNYKGNRGTCETTHYIRVELLEQAVLAEIRRLTRFATQYEDDFVRAIMGQAQKTVQSNRQAKQREYNTLRARDKELDALFEKIYEDNASGKLSEERFAKMSRRYETEQSELSVRIKALLAELEKDEDKAMTTDIFMTTVRKYTRAKKLTPRMLNELIEKIEVHQVEKVSGEHIQRLTIHYNCIGSIDIPELERLPSIDLKMPTRKGVVTSYAGQAS